MNEHFDDFHGELYLNAFASQYDQVIENYIGCMDVPCLHWDSVNFKDEAVEKEFTACCNKGSIILPPLTIITQFIEALYNGKLITNVS